MLPYGDRAVLIEPADPAAVLAIRDWLSQQGHSGILAVVPAARTVLVEVDPARLPIDRLPELLADGPAGQLAETPDRPVLELPVRYAGADLAAVAREVNLGIDDLVTLHSSGDYTVRFCGFSPGFGYLTGLDPRLRLPRLATPRPAVPAGSIAIADGYTGVYPRSSPGGWRLLGSTDVELFDLDREPPALLAPGTRVRFVPQ
ncbi:MAG: 5-oxoprolinase subunit B family protein [Jatrophihabitantaceae bacterium]